MMNPIKSGVTFFAFWCSNKESTFSQNNCGGGKVSSVIKDEETLVQKAKENPEAFGILYERYVKKIYNYIFYRVGNHHDAEDLTSKTFYKALDNIDRYVSWGVPFSAWLYRIAHNLVANWHRDRSRRKVIPLDGLVVAGGHGDRPEKAIETSEEREELLKVIRRLPADRQQLLVLKFVERMSNVQIGQIMGRSEGAIKSLYHRTLITLRKELNKHRADEERES
jgi:RNA polymerase sigma-70 factor (ECF subfamily)